MLTCVPLARAEDPPGAPPVPPPFSEEAGFLGVSGVAVTAEPTASPSQPGDMGVAWAQTQPVRWDAIQPRAPIADRMLSDWTALDATVARWQRAGFAPLLTLSPASAWASQPVDQTDWARFVRERLPSADATLAIRAARGAAPPRGEHWKAWQAFVRAAVERYDGDGREDASGLLRPVRQVQILDRIQDGDHWLGSADDHLRLLHHAAEGAGEADARCEIVHAAVDLRGLFRAEDEVADGWKERLTSAISGVPPFLRLEAERGVGLVLRSLEMPSLYRAMPHAGSGSLREDGVNLRALRALLDARGSTNVPVWLTDSPIRRLTPARVPLPGETRGHAAEKVLREAVMRAELEAVQIEEGRRREPGTYLSWLHTTTAHDLVRGAALGRAALATRVLVSDEFVHAFPRSPAAWFAARQMNTLLLGHRGASEAPLGASGTAVVFTFGERAPLPWVAVLLLDDGGVWGGVPGQPLPVKRVQVPLPPGDVDVEELALADGPPKRRRVKVVEGLLPLDLTSAPVYVFPAR